MSDLEPPDYLDQGPPPDAGYSGGGKRRNDPPKLTPAQVAEEAATFFGWLAHHERVAEFKTLLPDKISPAIFIDACKTAVTKKSQYLRADWRQSLMLAVMDAAGCGLMPDGKEGAIVPRYDTEAREMRLVFQPMVWGIVKLGRETGAIRSIRAKIVFFGDDFAIEEGEVDLIRHTPSLDLMEAAYQDLYGGLDSKSGNVVAKPDAFMGHVRGAYCFIVGVDGLVTKRYMPRARLIILKNASRAKNGPWNSAWIDEMILKAVILYTSKWINLDLDTASARRFQSALAIDSAADVPDGEMLDRPEISEPLALSAPGPKLDMFTEMFQPKEKVAASAPEPKAKPTEGSPKQPAPPAVEEKDELAENADKLLAALPGYNRRTLATLTDRDEYKTLIGLLSEGDRNHLLVKIRNAVTQAATRD